MALDGSQIMLWLFLLQGEYCQSLILKKQEKGVLHTETERNVLDFNS